jgi:ribonuclease HI
MKQVTLTTDGACVGNPGPGGWAYILRTGQDSAQCSGGSPDTTNNRMEMLAVIEGLKALDEPCEVLLLSDSEYLLKGIRYWRFNWRVNGWKRKLKSGEERPVKNVDLWQELDGLSDKHLIRGQWVRGHSGHPDNEKCDRLAQSEAEKFVDLPCWTSFVSRPVSKKYRTSKSKKSGDRKAPKVGAKKTVVTQLGSKASTQVAPKRSALSKPLQAKWVIAPPPAPTTPTRDDKRT